MQKLFFSLSFTSELSFVKIRMISLLKHVRHFKQIFNDFQLYPLFLEVTNF
jgi:hypothetical protein